MNELRTIISSIHILPAWAEKFIAQLIGVLLILVVLNLILKNLQTPQMKKALAVFKLAGVSALRDIGKSLELPVKRPRLELLALSLMTINTYFMAFVFFLFFGMAFILFMSVENLEFWRRILSLLLTMFLALVARYFFAEAERERLVVIEKWKNLKYKSSP